uniref:c-Myc-binding protein n=1 Tax=Spongospora subterranea TaxID=70186 RepID=A0A0H5RJX2_9EUKA|eukprot:CRZ09024.1 hypothetical protein [Spongospora subterranea]
MNSSLNLQTAESKKEQFQEYLEKSGVIDALTKVLVALYEAQERPPAENAIDFIKEYLGAPIGVDIDELRKTCERQRDEIGQLNKTIAEMTTKIESLNNGVPGQNVKPEN